MAKIQGSDGLVRKRIIAILNIDSIFWPREVPNLLVIISSKWVYMLNSVEKWLFESQKKKTVFETVCIWFDLTFNSNMLHANSSSDENMQLYFLQQPKEKLCAHVLLNNVQNVS
jgi:hypothetical protein